MSVQKLIVSIPHGLDFADLKLVRNPQTGGVGFDWSPIESICAASGIDIALLRDGPDDNVSGLIVAWYSDHRARGGAPDPVQEDLIAEMLAENEHGDGLSHEPGRA